MWAKTAISKCTVFVVWSFSSFGRFRRLVVFIVVLFSSLITDVVNVVSGDKLPSVDLYENTPTAKVNIAELTAGKKVIIIGVPGAFTPCCSKTHLPSYISDYEKFKSKGIDEIVCVAVNDPYVMAAWGKDQNADGKVRMLADTNGAFAKAVDLEKDMSGPLGNVRCQRFSMFVDDGVVKALNVEPDGTGASCSLSNNILSQF